MPEEFPIYRPPPFTVHHSSRLDVRGQQVDWSHSNFGINHVHLRTKGEGIRVAVLDTGMDLDHADLRDNLLASKDFTNSGSANDPRSGHGTHCAGIIAAVDNAVGVIGVAPLAKLLIGKVLGDDGSGYDSWISRGIDWAIDQKADVISLSLGSPQYSAVTHGSIVEAVKQHGIFIVAAAGNSGFSGVDYPGALPETIAVAAVDKNNRRADFSAVGNEVDIAGPGVKILSTYPNDRVAELSGTSMATPFVAAAIACILSYRLQNGRGKPTLDEMRQLLRDNAADVGTPGRDAEYGWGLIRPKDMLGPPPPPDPPIDPPGPPDPPVVPPAERIRRLKGTIAGSVPIELDVFYD